MNQVKTGKFIAECRKEKNLTQMQLAEKLGITDKAISKWERGVAMPDASLMLELCDILGINVNELLSGERMSMENYPKEMEKRLVEMVKEKERKDKQMLTLEWVLGILSCIVLFVPVCIATFLPMEEWQRVVVLFSGFVPAIVGFAFALKIEQVAGYYECAACGHKYVPSYKAVNLAMHMGRTRYMRCPKCKKMSWQKKRISKE